MKFYEIGTFESDYNVHPPVPHRQVVRRLYADYFIKRVFTAGGGDNSFEFYRNLSDGSSYLYAAYSLSNGYAIELDDAPTQA